MAGSQVRAEPNQHLMLVVFRPLCFVMLLLVVGSVAHAQGGPPMQTDDPGTPGDGRWEVNIAATSTSAGATSEAELPLVDINYGLGERLQLKFEVPWLHEDNSRTDHRSGLGNSTIGLKLRFHDAGAAGWQISTYPQVTLGRPAARRTSRAVGDPHSSLFLPVEMQRSYESYSLNLEIGRRFRNHDRDEWEIGAVIGRDWTSRLEVMAELHTTASETLDGFASVVNLGARWRVSDSGALLFALGRDINNTMDNLIAAHLYLGWQFSFGSRRSSP